MDLVKDRQISQVRILLSRLFRVIWENSSFGGWSWCILFTQIAPVRPPASSHIASCALGNVDLHVAVRDFIHSLIYFSGDEVGLCSLPVASPGNLFKDRADAETLMHHLHSILKQLAKVGPVSGP